MPKPTFLERFVGSGVLGSAMESTGCSTVGLDLNAGYDLTDTDVQAVVLDCISADTYAEFGPAWTAPVGPGVVVAPARAPPPEGFLALSVHRPTCMVCLVSMRRNRRR